MKELTIQDAKLLSPLVLAYIGDGVYELITREHTIAKGNMPAAKLHQNTVALVCAAAQSRGCEAIADCLTEEETAIFKRGRNANGNHIPRTADPQDYRRATGLEALFGFLYLTGQTPRARELYELIYQALEVGQEQPRSKEYSILTE